MKEIYDKVSFECSKLITNAYSTSFSLGIKSLDGQFHAPIYAIYGFVRAADEIVDTFHEYPKSKLLDKFKQDTYQAIREGISLNPILHSFQAVVNQFNIDLELIDTFLHSMEMDLHRQEYNTQKYKQYIRGSAEVVGLMCLKVFVVGDDKEYEKLKLPAMKLGSAFQKVNFLRDLKNDYQNLGRRYFPGIDLDKFDSTCKTTLEQDIKRDFEEGYGGIKDLPQGARFGVYCAYVYYRALLTKICRTPPELIMSQRIRIPNFKKYLLFLNSYFKYRFNLI